MNKAVNTSIYAIYIIIALVSVTISYKVSLSLTLIVVALEYVRLIALYKKVYSVILLVFALNLTLLTYNSYKQQQITSFNNSSITVQNELTIKYLDTKDLRASTFKDLNSNIKQLENVELEYWFISLVYVLLELSLIALVFGIARQEKQALKSLKTENKAIKKQSKKKTKRETKEKEEKKEQKKEQLNGKNEELEALPSYRIYASNKSISRKEAEELYKTWEKRGLLIKINNKNYLRKEV